MRLNAYIESICLHHADYEHQRFLVCYKNLFAHTIAIMRQSLPVHTGI